MKRWTSKRLFSDARAWDLASSLESQWPLPRTAAQRRMLCALYEDCTTRYLMYYGTTLVGILGLKKKWSRFHIVSLGSIKRGAGKRLYKLVCKKPLEVVTTPQAKGFYLKMGMTGKDCAYHNVLTN